MNFNDQWWNDITPNIESSDTFKKAYMNPNTPRTLIKCASWELIEAIEGIAPIDGVIKPLQMNGVNPQQHVSACGRLDADEIHVAVVWYDLYKADDDEPYILTAHRPDFSVNCRECCLLMLRVMDPIRRDYLLERELLGFKVPDAK